MVTDCHFIFGFASKYLCSFAFIPLKFYQNYTCLRHLPFKNINFILFQNSVVNTCENIGPDSSDRVQRDTIQCRNQCQQNPRVCIFDVFQRFLRSSRRIGVYIRYILSVCYVTRI